MTIKDLTNKMENWLDTINYWEDEVRDVAECAERINKMGMYREYEVVQEEIYNLWKQLETEVKNETQI